VRRTFLLLLIVQGASFAQPFIFNRGISNSASSLPFGIPAGTIAQGSIFSIYGRNLGPSTGVQPSAFPLNATLSGVSVSVTDGITPLNAYPVYVSASQVNAIMPSNTPLGSVSVRVTVKGITSNSVPVRIGPASLGLFTALRAGAGPGIIFNYVTEANQPLNSVTTPAKPGQVVTMWGTGLGPVTADNVAPTAGNLPISIEVFVGGTSATSSYHGRSPCCAGDDQIVFQVPLNAPTGCWVPVNVRLAGTAVSNTVTMAVTKDGSSCVTSASNPAKAFIQGGKVGLLAPMRVDLNQSAPSSPLDLRTDFLAARFGQEKGGPLAFNPLVSLPPAGTCTAYAGPGDWFISADLPNLAPSVKALDAGGGTVTAGGKAGTYVAAYSPLLLGYLGSSNPTNTAGDTTLLGPGGVKIQIAGGADVPAFNAAATMIAPLTWTNQSQISTINRADDLQLTWTGGSGQTIAAVGGNVDVITNSSGIFVCVASPGATSITVPALMLANVPEGRGDPHYSKGAIFLVGAGATGTFNASGLDQGFLVPMYLTGKAVAFQ
jgi:uncharacterized protein (TIGR03437 family)